jgi:hypothetical protein
MDFTRLRQMARLGRLLARKHDKNFHNDQPAAMQSLDHILDPTDPRLEKPKALNETDLAQFLAKKKKRSPSPHV